VFYQDIIQVDRINYNGWRYGNMSGHINNDHNALTIYYEMTNLSTSEGRSCEITATK
jgi:hypothetical protein